MRSHFKEYNITFIWESGVGENKYKNIFQVRLKTFSKKLKISVYSRQALKFLNFWMTISSVYCKVDNYESETTEKIK